MRDWIQLPRRLIVRCYALCREAERSVDRALVSASWSDLVAYYHEKIETIEQTREQLASMMPESATAQAPPDQEEVFRNHRPWALFRAVLGKWVAARSEWWAFPCPEVQFLVSKLHSLTDLLRERDRPAQGALIRLRMDLFDCQRVIDRRCQGLPELEKAARIEHFLHPEHCIPVKFEDLIAEADPIRPVT